MNQAANIGAEHYKGTVRVHNGKATWTGVLHQSPAHIINKPRKLKHKSMIFVNSMSDFFHDKAEYAWQLAAMRVIEDTPQHVYQILTKRPEFIQNFLAQYKKPFPVNVWVGATMERHDYRWRIATLRDVPAQVRFLSLEPLVGPVKELDLTGIGWVIIGGESGGGARVMKYAWVREAIDQCIEQGVPVFFKQWGIPESNPLYGSGGALNVRMNDPQGKGGSLVDGKSYKQFPRGVQAHEYQP